MAEYLLCDHVHLCLTRDGAILLDLHKDEYLSLNQSQVAIMGGLVRGVSVGTNTDGRGSRADEFIQSLIARRIVTTDARTGKPAAPAEIEAPELSLAGPDYKVRHYELRTAVHFASACVHTAVSLRMRTLDRVIAAIAQRKRAGQTTTDQSIHEIEKLVHSFVRMRPFVYTPHDHCLFDSMTLINFLSAYRIYPKLVFGVRSSPFEAHAWVQYGKYSLNSAADYVGGFSPILSV